MQTIKQRPDRLAEEFQKGFYDDVHALRTASVDGAQRARRGVRDWLNRLRNSVRAVFARLVPILFLAFTFPQTLLAEVTAALLVLVVGIFTCCANVTGNACLIQTSDSIFEVLHLA